MRAILFDLDGTLVESRLGIVRCIRHVLEGLAARCPSDDDLATFIGPPLRLAFGTLLATSDAALVEKAMTLYRERYATTGLYEGSVYDGVPAALEGLRQGGARLFVVTSKPTVFAERVVRHFALAPHFAGVFGPELDGRFDDKGELIGHLAAREAIGDAVMIGDRAADIIAARAHGLRSVGVLWGYGSRQELLDAGADDVCAAPSALPACLARLAR